MISVIVPIYNEEKGITKCIESILPQISITDEIIVVASGCTDGTIDAVMNIPDNRVRLIVQKEREGKASAINLAVSKSFGDVIVQTDGDVFLEENAINKLLLWSNIPDCVAVSGHPIPIIPENNIFFDWTIMSYRKIHDLRTKENAEGKFWHLSGYLLAFKKEAFVNLPFAKGAVDAVMGMQLKEKGKISYASDALVYVKAPLTIKDFVAQKARVRAGFANLKGTRTAQSEIGSFFPELFKIKIWRWPKFIFCAFIYTYCWIKGRFIKDKSLAKIWKVPTSTK